MYRSYLQDKYLEHRGIPFITPTTLSKIRRRIRKPLLLLLRLLESLTQPFFQIIQEVHFRALPSPPHLLPLPRPTRQSTHRNVRPIVPYSAAPFSPPQRI